MKWGSINATAYCVEPSKKGPGNGTYTIQKLADGKTSAAGANVDISGGTKFYLTAPLNQAENVSATFSSKMKGSIDKEYSAYKITTGSGTQDLALVFGEGVGNEKYVDFKVTWTKECKADC